MRRLFVFTILLGLRILARLVCRLRVHWIARPAGDPWSGVRVISLLHHTSLFEWLLILAIPVRFLWRVAGHGVVPAAEKTLRRPVVGFFFRSLAAHVVSITRERDHTWREVLAKIEPESIVLILPEGRMMRRNGLDSNGQPMTVRGGISDIIEAVPNGRMLLAYSGGLHHVQAPGDRFPRLFRTLWLNLESVDLSDYRATLQARQTRTGRSVAFKRVVIEDLERRRDLFCPTEANRRAWAGRTPGREALERATPPATDLPSAPTGGVEGESPT